MPAALNNSVDPGELRHRITLLAMDGDRDAAGEFTERVIADGVWAAVAPMSGQARYMVQEFAGRSSHVITVRYRKGVEVGTKVRFRGRLFEVVYPLNPDEANRWLHLLCMEETATPVPGGGS